MYRSAFACGVFLAALSFGVGAAPFVELAAGMCRSCGTVVDVDPIFARGRNVGSGALLGALVGGAVGNRIGSGDTTATVAGAAAGAAMGYNGTGRKSAVSGYEITIEMDGGRLRTIRSADDFDLDRGDRVRVTLGKVSRL